MKAAIFLLMMSASILVVSCGQDSPDLPNADIGSLGSEEDAADDQSDVSDRSSELVAEADPAGSVESGNASEATGTDVNTAGVATDTVSDNNATNSSSNNVTVHLGYQHNYYQPVSVETEYSVDYETEGDGEDSKSTAIVLLDNYIVGRQLLKNNRILFQEIPPPPQPVATMTLQNGEAAWLVAYELTGGILKFAKAKEEGEIVILDDVGPVENYNGEMVDCEKMTMGIAAMVGLDYKGEAYPTGNLDVSMEICMRKNDDVSKLLSPISFSIDAADFKYFDPCLGEVVLNGHSECIGILVNSKKDPYVNYSGTYFCSTDSVKYKVSGMSYIVETPVKGAHLIKNISGKLLTELSTYSFSGDIQVGQKYTNFGLKQPASEKVAACLNN